MLDFGFPELLLIMAMAVVVLGPNELTKIMVMLGRLVRRINYMKFAMSRQFDDFMREHDMEDIRKQVNFEAPDIKAHEMDEAAYDEGLAEAPDLNVAGVADTQNIDPSDQKALEDIVTDEGDFDREGRDIS